MSPRALAVMGAVVAVMLAVSTGCSGGSATGLGGRPGGGPDRYWTRHRLLDATPWLGPGYHRAPAPSQPKSAHPASLVAVRVGALFTAGSGGDHFCTASVVASPGKDLLITAAHCLSSGNGAGYRQDIVFVPDYRDGQAPFGVWTPERLLVAPQWLSSADPDLDVGFVVLEPHDGKNIQDILGANQLAVDSGYHHLVWVTGYPESADAPVTCRNWTTEHSATQLQFDCGGYTGGTSGSPWVTRTDPLTPAGTIVGVIGGYQEGGDTAAVSYSSYLDSAVRRLYAQAAAIKP